MKRFVTILLMLCVSASAVMAVELMMPSRQVGAGTVALAWFQSQRDFTLKTNGSSRIRVGSLSYVSAVSNEYSIRTSNSGALAKMLFQPHDGLVYWLGANSTSYEIEVPSFSHKNLLRSQVPGWGMCAGLRRILMPDTIVSPAVSVEAGISHSRTPVSVMYAGSPEGQIIDNVFSVTEYHIGLGVSKKYAKVEPYGGVTITRAHAVMRDNAAVIEVGGYRDTAAATVGLRLYPYKHESLICEASFIGEASFILGWNVEF